MPRWARDVNDALPHYGAQRFSAWFQGVPAERDHTYERGGVTYGRFAKADPTDVDAIGFSPSSSQLLIAEFKKDPRLFLENVGQSNAIRRTAQLPGAHGRVIGEPDGQRRSQYPEDILLPFGTVERNTTYGLITPCQLANAFVALRQGDALDPDFTLEETLGRGLEVTSAWWPADLPAAAAPHHIAATFQVGFGNATSHHLFIEFVQNISNPLADMTRDKLAMFMHLGSLPHVTTVVAQDPHFGELVAKGQRYERAAPMPFVARDAMRRQSHPDATVDEFNTWIHDWLLDADSYR